MMIWAVVATVVAVLLGVTGTAYRRQIKKISEQIRFQAEHDTNLRVSGGLPFSELNDLTDSINEIVDRTREIREETKKGEESLRETITSLSHDIRTPLTSLDGYFQLLAEAETDEEREHYLVIIRSRIASLTSMLEELFTYTKLQNESYELALEETDISRCVMDTVFSFYDEFRYRKIEPEIRFSDERMIIEGNAEAVSRALQNVIKNALEHGDEHISMEFYRESGRAVFRCTNKVNDITGIDADRVFERFYKADSARNGASTGLGLSIAKGLIEKMGGTIEAELSGDSFSVEICFDISGGKQEE